MPASTVWSVSAPLSCARCAAEQRGQLVAGDGQRVRAEPGDARDLERVADEVDGQPLLGARPR